MTVKSVAQDLPLESIKLFGATADLRKPDRLLESLGIAAIDRRWPSKDGGENIVVFSARLFGGSGNLVYISDNAKAELLFLIEREHAPVVSKAALYGAFPSLTLKRSPAAPSGTAGAYVARENSVDIIFCSDDVDAEAIVIAGLFFENVIRPTSVDGAK